MNVENIYILYPLQLVWSSLYTTYMNTQVNELIIGHRWNHSTCKLINSYLDMQEKVNGQC